MKCTNRKRCVISAVLVLCVLLSGCGGLKYEFAYNPDYGVSSFRVTDTWKDLEAESFAQELCIVSEDVSSGDAGLENAGAAGLFDLSNSKVLAAKNAHERLYPASLTKVMTALVAIKNGSMDQILTATDSVKITEPGATLCGIKPGDSMTLDQALHLLLVNSSNDAGALIAENVAGSIEGFVDMMNAEALRLGATNTHFSNPHGLPDETHYSTAYDMYLIFNEAVKYESLTQIMHMSSYETVYKDSEGNDKEVSARSSNLYLRDEASAPERVTVIGGKTGTTNAAGHCLILLSKDTSGNSYISVILREPTKEDLYTDMTKLLNEITK